MYDTDSTGGDGFEESDGHRGDARRKKTMMRERGGEGTLPSRVDDLASNSAFCDKRNPLSSG